MTKRILSLILAALTLFALCAPALASGEPAAEDIPAIETPAEPEPEDASEPEATAEPEATTEPEVPAEPEMTAEPEPEEPADAPEAAGTDSPAAAAGDTIATATAVALPSGTTVTVKGAITGANAKDYYTFTLDISGTVEFSAVYEMTKAPVYLYDSGYKQVWTETVSADQNIGIGQNKATWYLSKGTYYFAVNGDGKGTEGDYTLNFKFTSSGESFLEDTNGVNNTFDAASAIKPGTEYTGFHPDRRNTMKGEYDQKDYYTFTLTSASVVKLTYKFYGTGNTYFYLYNEEEKEFWYNSLGNTQNELTFYLAKGVYYFLACRYDPGGNSNHNYPGVYTFRFDVTPVNESFPEGITGTNNTVGTASSVTLGQTYAGFHPDRKSCNDDVDYYKFTLSRTSDLSILTNAVMKRMNLYIYDSQEKKVFEETAFGSEQTPASEHAVTLASGTYYLAVERYTSGGNSNDTCPGPYTFAINLKTPQLTDAAAVSGGIRITWEAVTGAEKYQVLCKTGSGQWTTLADTASTSYTWTEAKSGTSYTFTVRCISSSGAAVSGYDTTGRTVQFAGAKNGLVTENGKTYFYVNGVKQVDKLVTAADGKMYYCAAGDGHIMKGGTKKINGKFYYLAAGDGHVMKGGWIKVDGKNRYYADKNGVLYINFHAIGKQSYYFSEKDAHLMKGGVVNGGNGKMYYVSDKDGHAMKGGWARGKAIAARPGYSWFYYLDSTGLVRKTEQKLTSTVVGKIPAPKPSEYDN